MFAAHNQLHVYNNTPSAVPLGLSSSLLSFSGTNGAWNQRSINISAYANRTVKLVFKYVSGISFTGDIQLDDISIDGTTYDFESGATYGFETTVATVAGETFTYSTISWNSVLVFTSGARWNSDLGGTPSTNTGLTVDHTLGTTSGYYLYAETTSPGYSNTEFWLRSPSIALSSSPGTLTFWEAREGATIGTCDVYLDVIV